MKFFSPESVKFRRPEYWFPVISFVFISFSTYHLYKNLTLAEETGSTRVVGKIFYKNNTAQRKYTARVTWNDLNEGTDVYNYDTIRTDIASEAIIELEDGTHIEMDQNSMIVLSLSEKEKTANIKFRGGSIRAHKTDEEKGELAVKIDAGERTISSDKNGDIQLSGKDEKSMVVTLKEGEANISYGQEKQELKKDQQAEISRDKVNVRLLNLKLSEPENRRRYYIDKSNIDLKFGWKQPEGEKIIVEVSDDPEFKYVKFQKTENAGESVFNLPEGIYYWRIRNQGGSDISEIRSVNIIKKDNLNLYGPSDGESYIYSDTPPLVGFSWSKNNLASSYLVEIASDPNFKNIIQKETSQTTSISLKMKEGIYYWRVATRGGPEGEKAISSSQNFNIKKIEHKITPRLLLPETNAVIDNIYISENGYVFRWFQNQEIKRYEFSVSKESTFREPVVFETSSVNFFGLKKDLKEGLYYWRIRGIDKKNQPTEYSSVSSFVITRAENLKLIMPAQNLQIGTAEFNAAGLNLTWKDYAEDASYKLIISRSKSMQNPVLSVVVRGNQYHLSSIESDTYYWQIKLLGDKKREILESDIRSFTVYDRLADPVPGYPVQNAVIDITDLKFLEFRWKEIPDAQGYEIIAYRKGTGIILFQDEVKKGEYVFKNMETLESGDFIWAVTAKKEKNGKAFRSNRIERNFTILIKTIPPPEIKF